MLVKELQQNIENYKSLLTQTQDSQEKKALQNLILTAIKEMERIQLNEQKQQFNSKIEESFQQGSGQNERKKALIDIFYFYSKLLYTHGEMNDFGKIMHDSQVLNMGKFIIFCRQFHILLKSDESKVKRQIPKVNGHKWWLSEEYIQEKQNILQEITKQKRIKQLTRQEIQNEFKKVANPEINFWQFEELLHLIANQIYDQEENSYERFLVEVLHIKNKGYKKYLKVLNQAFSCQEKEGFRLLPGYEKYLFREPDPKILKEKHKVIEQWQLLKKKEIHDRNTQSQSVNFLSRPKMKTLKDKSPEDYRKRRQLSLEDKKNQLSMISWEKLNSMHYLDILNPKKDSFLPNQLIEDATETEDQFYLKKLKMEDQKIDINKRANQLQEILMKYGQVDGERYEHKLKQMPPPIYPRSAISIGKLLYQQNRYHLVNRSKNISLMDRSDYNSDALNDESRINHKGMNNYGSIFSSQSETHNDSKTNYSNGKKRNIIDEYQRRAKEFK